MCLLTSETNPLKPLPLLQELRMNRSVQVEGAFSVIEQGYGFRRFLIRGKENVNIEMLLLCFSFNINKLHNKTAKNRRRTQLFEKRGLR